jgi:hypothetical protein
MAVFGFALGWLFAVSSIYFFPKNSTQRFKGAKTQRFFNPYFFL